jgi:hypothetical protein
VVWLNGMSEGTDGTEEALAAERLANSDIESGGWGWYTNAEVAELETTRLTTARHVVIHFCWRRRP